MKALGYMTGEEALAQGFTHHGKYFCVSVYLAPENKDFPVAAKWAPLEYVISIIVCIEGFMRSLLFPYDEPCFQFAVLDKIIPASEKP